MSAAGFRARTSHGPVPDPASRRLADRGRGRDPIRTPGPDGLVPSRLLRPAHDALSRPRNSRQLAGVLRPRCWRGGAGCPSNHAGGVTELIALMGEKAGEGLAYAQAMRHLESALRRSMPSMARPSAPGITLAYGAWPLADALEALRAHFTFGPPSSVMPCGWGGGGGRNRCPHLQFAHGIWVPWRR